jgi:hypothetical protein
MAIRDRVSYTGLVPQALEYVDPRTSSASIRGHVFCAPNSFGNPGTTALGAQGERKSGGERTVIRDERRTHVLHFTTLVFT